MRDDLEEKMNELAFQSSSYDMGDMVTYSVWASIVTVTRAFEKVALKIDTNTNRIFVSIQLRWWAKIKKLEFFRAHWMRRAEEKAKQFVPNGYKILIYYAKEGLSEGQDTKRS